MWRKLWLFNIPGLTKIFVWKAITNCLPTKKNLFKRKVVKDALCPVCRKEDESICHALWSCSGSGDVWACEWSPVQKWSANERDFFELWSEWSLRLTQDQMELIAVVLRRIWFRMNGWVFENRFKGPNDVFSQAANCLSEYQQAQETQQTQSKQSNSQCGRALHWKPPEGDTVKVNWDAALKSDDRKCGMGVVIRDSCGDVLASLCSCRLNVSNPVIA
ncbi:uncharacterized protein LOC122304891 [Carya illinoinensis]|uniref:uncharacterized protein LOC122304891 n=1 Tax=Carya illinoinensis TaxID=32201 RepID=UPI001C72933B|nr:uncharacterized protein LOC122304891 [Carya illinoinensis]